MEFMGGIMQITFYLFFVVIFAMIAYFVIKKAVKDALIEWEESKKNRF
jgi:p-aminobenzoyl-glutamate transporter AbgT